MGWEPPELAGLLQGAVPHPRHRLLILPAAQQSRLGIAFSFGLTKTHTAPHPARHALQSLLGLSWTRGFLHCAATMMIQISTWWMEGFIAVCFFGHTSPERAEMMEIAASSGLLMLKWQFRRLRSVPCICCLRIGP